MPGSRIAQLATFALSALAGSAFGQREANHSLQLPVELPTGQYALQPVTSGNAVLTISAPPGVTDQLYLGERAGRIRVVTDWPGNAEPRQTSFLDISSRVTTSSENGLLGVAFHPRYASNGYVFVCYTTRASGRATDRLSRFTRSANDPLQVDPDSELILYDQADDAGNHNGGDIHFGPDGYLYVSLGDEGGGNDTYGNSQRVNKDLFSGMLRLDVDRSPGSVEPTRHDAIPLHDGKAAFAIPPDNPLVSTWQDNGADPQSPLRLEFFAIGLRNPWRFDIDSATGDIWVGDVGQSAREEIDLVTKGGNYGWATREGVIDGPRSQTPPEGFGGFVEPVYDYPRSLGYSVTGGVVYRGAALPELYGAYVFGDYGSGNIFALIPDPNGGAPEVSVIANLPANAEFAIDPSNGDVLISSVYGDIVRLVRGDGASGAQFPSTLGATGAFRDLDTLEPETGIYPYEPILAFWSDYAIKSRWFALPESQTITYRQDAPWEFPVGTVWIKQFDLELERGNPETARRVETRFLVRVERGVYGVSYQWNESGTEATLVPPEGATLSFQVTDNGETRQQTWTIPSRQQCLSCHTPAAGFALSFNARQLNHSYEIDGQERNLLAYLSEQEFLDTAIEDPETVPRYVALDDETATLEQRVRSYLAVNCAACHQPNGGAPNTWDARPQLSIAETGLINGVAADDGGDASRRLVVRGDTDRSILLHRIAASDGFSRMPPIATNELDRAAIDLITRWIELVPPIDQSFAEWQTAYFGSPDLPDAAPGHDPDGDGNSNRLEYLNRTRPLDPTSVWRPEFSQNGSAITVKFPMAPGRAFVIQSSDDLATWTDWNAAGNPPDSDPIEPRQAQITGTPPENANAEFLRIKVSE